MDEVHIEMVAVCDRLLNLLTGKDPLDGTDQAAAHEAIALLIALEDWLKSNAYAALPSVEGNALALLNHRVLVLEHLKPVVDLLEARRCLPEHSENS